MPARMERNCFENQFVKVYQVQYKLVIILRAVAVIICAV